MENYSNKNVSDQLRMLERNLKLCVHMLSNKYDLKLAI